MTVHDLRRPLNCFTVIIRRIVQGRLAPFHPTEGARQSASHVESVLLRYFAAVADMVAAIVAAGALYFGFLTIDQPQTFGQT